MQVNYRYFGQSKVTNDSHSSKMQFAPDTLRDPTYFVAELGNHIPFREAISAMHDVVVADLRFTPKDRTDYQSWLAEYEQSMMSEMFAGKVEIKTAIKDTQRKLSQLLQQKRELLAPYYKAQDQYFKYLYKHDYNAWFVLDPVISIHPDQVFFECFSQDESSYARLSCSHNIFKAVQQMQYGTTNIDYSTQLYDEFQKIRDYKTTRFEIEPQGFSLQTGDDAQFNEQKIDLPDSWIRGFLQVCSAMTLPMVSFSLHPMDIHNFCFVLKRQKERHGPRSIRFELTPEHPVKAIFEPWDHEVICHRSKYQGQQKHSIRIWGRRRLLVLERLIPIAKKFSVSLLGSGLPSFFQADLGEMTFTLGLSGWTANDWSKVGNFDLMASRGEADEMTVSKVLTALKKHWFCNADKLAKELNLDKTIVLSALSMLAQSGNVVYDLGSDNYRYRDATAEPIDTHTMRFANERERLADNWVNANLVTLHPKSGDENTTVLSGTVLDNAVEHRPSMTLDNEQRLIGGQCSCHFYVHNKLYKGPCEHMLALRRQQQKEAQ